MLFVGCNPSDGILGFHLALRRPGLTVVLPASCQLCRRRDPPVSAALRVCATCIKTRPDAALSLAERAHERARLAFGLPSGPPRDQGGVQCTLCVNECRIGEGRRGYCGLRTVADQRLIHLAGSASGGLLHWYRDPLPTNCVADWVCHGSRQTGSHNLAVFYGSCTADCLFCQNWHYRRLTTERQGRTSARQLAEVANSRTHCVCFFGGDPASQMPHALAVSRLLARSGIRVCWETNGSMHPRLLEAALDLSLRTGGCVKFDLKAFDDNLHRALTGISNRRTLDNLSRAARRFRERPDPPLIVASTLLVPGYVEADEVGDLARFIAALEPEIPYSLLAFAPAFEMTDLPCTSSRQAEKAEEAARSAGLMRVRLGNRHLLDWA